MISKRRSFRTTLRQKKFAQVALENATSYEDWARAALDLDDLEGIGACFVNTNMSGRGAWKDDPESPEYDYNLLCRRLNQLRDARTAGDLKRVLFLLRISLTRNFAHSGSSEVCRTYT